MCGQVKKQQNIRDKKLIKIYFKIFFGELIQRND